MFSPEEIGTRLKVQDNASTAAPYIIALQEKVERQVTENMAYDHYKFYDSNLECSFSSTEEWEKAMKEHGYDDEDIKKNRREIVEYYVKDVWEDRNWFFTYEGYKEHLRLNKHNYGEVRSYIYHCFRNPEMKAVWDLLVGKALTPNKEAEAYDRGVRAAGKMINES
jgi:hypothetical protein